MEQSKKFSLNSIDWKKIGVGAGVAVVGTLLTYVTQVVGQIDFGQWTPLVVCALSIIVNIGRKWVSDNSEK